MMPEFDNEENSMRQDEQEAKAYFGKMVGECFICPNQVHVSDLIRFEDKRYGNRKVWYICHWCHQAFFYHNYTNEDIIQALCTYEKQRKALPDRELRDKKRSNKDKITYEEQADLSWELHFHNKWEDFLKQ